MIYFRKSNFSSSDKNKNQNIYQVSTGCPDIQDMSEGMEQKLIVKYLDIIKRIFVIS